MQSLNHFQQQTANALLDSDIRCPDSVIPNTTKGNSRRFDIYRNNRAVSLIDNLQSTYPVVLQLVGEEFFNAVARLFIDQSPPQSPVMMEYGADFSTFISRFPGAESVPYLADMAKLEWACLQSYHASDTTTLTLAELSHCPQEQLLNSQLITHPAVDAIVSEWPIASIWSAVKGLIDGASIQTSKGEIVVIARPHYDVNVHHIEPPLLDFLKLLTDGHVISDAASLLLDKQPEFDVGSALLSLTQIGVFAECRVAGPPNN